MGNSSSAEAIEAWAVKVNLADLLKEDRPSPEMRELRRLVKAVRLEERYNRMEESSEAWKELDCLVKAAELEQELTNKESSENNVEAIELKRLVKAYHIEKLYTDSELKPAETLDQLVKQVYNHDCMDDSPHLKNENIIKFLLTKIKEDRRREGAAKDEDECWKELKRLVKAYNIEKNMNQREAEEMERLEFKRLVTAAEIESNFTDSAGNDHEKLTPENLVQLVKDYFEEKSPGQIADEEAWKELLNLAHSYWIAHNLEERVYLREMERLAAAVALEDELEEKEPVLANDMSLDADELRRLVSASYIERHPCNADEVAKHELERLARVYLIAHNTKELERKQNKQIAA